MTLLSTPLGKIGALLLIVILLIIGIAWFGPVRPSESNRVRHPSGYSVIEPSGWSPDMRHGSGKPGPGLTPIRDLIVMTPDKFVGVPPSLQIKRMFPGIDPTQLTAHGWTNGQFQDQSAYIMVEKTKHALIHAAIFQRNGQWFEVAQTLPFAEQAHDAEMWQFLSTFKYPDGEVPPDVNVIVTTTQASTQPFRF